jgi:hypothetical protein
MFAKVRFIDGETRSYPRVSRLKVVGDFVFFIRRWGRRVVVPGREIRWVQLGKERKLEQKDFFKDITL